MLKGKGRLPKANVDYAICDWKEEFEDRDYKRLMKLPGEFHTPVLGEVDSKILVRAPKSMRDWLDRNAIQLHDYGDPYYLKEELYKGLYWDGKALFTIFNSELVPMDKWIKMEQEASEADDEELNK